MLLGALDLGSNSFHLLLARVTPRGELEKVCGRKATIRLEEAVAASGRILPETFSRALDAVGELLSEARRYDAKKVILAGTSALREAKNGGDFVAAVRARHGLEVEILSGEDEGRLVYHGARSRLPELPARVAVIDLGGGSVEVALGEHDSCSFSASLPLGFLRLTRELDAHGALDSEALERVTAHVRSVAASVVPKVRAFEPRAFILSGGTARALGGVIGIASGEALSTRKLTHLAEHFASCDAVRLLGLGVDSSRARGFGLGSWVLATLSELLGAPATRITLGGLREGLLLREIGGRSSRHARVHLHHAGRLARPSAG